MKTKLLITAAASAFITTRAFNSEMLETVLVHIDGEDVRVNKSDYDADQALPEGDRKYGSLASKAKQADNAADSAAAQPSLTPAPGVTTPPPPSSPDQTLAPPPVEPAPLNPPGAASPGAMGVSKEGKGDKTRFFVVGLTDGVKVTGNAAIDEAGYVTEKEAWDAIVAGTPH